MDETCNGLNNKDGTTWTDEDIDCAGDCCDLLNEREDGLGVNINFCCSSLICDDFSVDSSDVPSSSCATECGATVVDTTLTPNP